MDVYLVPLGAERHELYCEVPDTFEEEEAFDTAQEPQEIAPPGFLRRMKNRVTGFFKLWRDRFKEMLAEAERDRRESQHAKPAAGWAGQVKARTMRWVAESIAEQRLLWHLRRQVEACLHHPDDMTESKAAEDLRSSLARDYEKHRRWLIIDALAFAVSGVFMLVPGPNLIAYFFAFRLVGHYFSLRGARQGLDCITWRFVTSPPLTELRRAITLEPDARVLRVHDVASRLRLEHLVSFFERAAIPAR
jgi:hypothetical protein